MISTMDILQHITAARHVRILRRPTDVNVADPNGRLGRAYIAYILSGYGWQTCLSLNIGM